MAERERSTRHAAALVSPARERRGDRVARRRAVERRQEEAVEAQRLAERERVRGERAAARAIRYLPKAGEPGPAALRSWRRLRVPSHQDTSAVLAGAMPFLAEGGLGAEGAFIGQDMFSGGAFAFDPWVLYNRGVITAPNMILAGIVGSGKSALAKSLIVRGIAFGRRVYVVADPKGEHSAVAEAVGGRAIRLGHGRPERLNPLDAGYRAAGLSDEEWRTQVAARRRDLVGALAETVLDRPLSPVEHTAIDIALRAAVAAADIPVLPMIVDRMLVPDHADDPRLVEDGRLVAHALRRLVSGDLKGMFDARSTVEFDPTLPMLSLDLSRVSESNTLMSVLMTCCSAWMEAALQDPSGGQRWVIYDEAWRLISQAALLRRMDAQWRLARHFGIANLLIVHKVSDLETGGDSGSALRALAGSLLANSEVRVIYRQESDQLESTARLLGLTGTERSLLPGLATGQGLWRIKDRSFVVHHQLHPAELEMYRTDARYRTEGPRGVSRS